KNANATIKKNYHLDSEQFQLTKLALVGSIVSLQQTFKLVADRANSQSSDDAGRLWPELLLGTGDDAKKPSAQLAMTRWPELAMSHSDCMACHHDLQYPAWRQQRGYGYHLPGGRTIETIPGRPQIRVWPLAMLEVAARFLSSTEEPKARLDSLEKS